MNSSHRSTVLSILAWFGLAMSIVWGGMFAGRFYYQRSQVESSESGTAELLPCWRGDAPLYLHIAEHGYEPLPGAEGVPLLVFFPLFPGAIRLVHAATQLPHDLSAVLSCLAGTLAALLLARQHWLEKETGSGRTMQMSMLCLCLFPPAFFYRVPYSESLFLPLLALTLLSMQRHWNPLFIAVVIGLLTACRPVGIVAVPCYVYWLLKRHREMAFWKKIAMSAVSLWGIAAFIAFQATVYSDAWAFASLQDFYRVNIVSYSPHRKLFALITLEPITNVYGEYLRTGRSIDSPHPLLSLQLANPIYFLGGLSLVYVGWQRSWLEMHETILCLGLVLMPYATKGLEMSMLSQGRFVALALPLYYVAGRLVASLPRGIAVVLFILMGLFLFLYAALFGAGYFLI